MIGELLFSLVRIGLYFFIFYFIYRVIVGFLRGLTGENKKRATGQPPQPTPQKPVQTYTNVEDAKFKDIPPENKE